MWLKEAITASIVALLISIEIYNGYFVDRATQVNLFYGLWQLCEMLLTVLILLRPKGWIQVIIFTMLLAFCIQLHQFYEVANFKITITDIVCPILLTIAVLSFFYNRYRLKKKRHV